MDLKTQAFDIALKLSEEIKPLGGSEISLPFEENYCYSVTGKYLEKPVKLMVYFGAKGLKVVLQGKLTPAEKDELSQLLGINAALFTAKKEAEIKEPEAYAGIDESGKGDFFGPLVITAVYVDNIIRKGFANTRIADSKTMTDADIIRSYKDIVSHKSLIYHTIVLKPNLYNRIYPKMGNLNALLSLCHAKCIKEISRKIKPETVISDRFSNPARLQMYLDRFNVNANLISETGAEKYFAVALASVIARYKVLEWFHKASQILEIDLPKGGNSVTESVASKVVQMRGRDFLPSVVKMHFKNLGRV
ncbi:MAG: ribonuclease HIII [Ignavibacteriaceae bacterium]|nr:ribonuclease HIII [Ignavibacteriaceae bacterium]